jgi:hypothetical protein
VVPLSTVFVSEPNASNLKASKFANAFAGNVELELLAGTNKSLEKYFAVCSGEEGLLVLLLTVGFGIASELNAVDGNAGVLDFFFSSLSLALIDAVLCFTGKGGAFSSSLASAEKAELVPKSAEFSKLSDGEIDVTVPEVELTVNKMKTKLTKYNDLSSYNSNQNKTKYLIDPRRYKY